MGANVDCYVCKYKKEISTTVKFVGHLQKKGSVNQKIASTNVWTFFEDADMVGTVLSKWKEGKLKHFLAHHPKICPHELLNNFSTLKRFDTDTLYIIVFVRTFSKQWCYKQLYYLYGRYKKASWLPHYFVAGLRCAQSFLPDSPSFNCAPFGT